MTTSTSATQATDTQMLDPNGKPFHKPKRKPARPAQPAADGVPGIPEWDGERWVLTKPGWANADDRVTWPAGVAPESLPAPKYNLGQVVAFFARGHARARGTNMSHPAGEIHRISFSPSSEEIHCLLFGDGKTSAPGWRRASDAGHWATRYSIWPTSGITRGHMVWCFEDDITG